MSFPYGVIPLIVAYFLIALNIVADPFFRYNQEAREFQSIHEVEHHSTIFTFLSFSLALSLPILRLYTFTNLSEKLSVIIGSIGVIMMIAGLMFRLWAMYVNNYYTRSLRLQEEQHIISVGPYKYVRHPGYAGFFVAWVGFSLAAANWLVMILIPILIFVIYVWRILVEEKMLFDNFPDEYVAYASRTRTRMIPYIL
eukprot:TRINITY_DN18703_c0_g1_i1.p1 TRINITY_DN18703_c0_g1~~TRINITY_DN18703_c0_g1_i1.p1  ORF type:complete len:197 (+),score=2.49 TRINITY_DN18703_c0_g1_i1:34-624(+)